MHGQLIKMLYMYIQCFLLNKHNNIITETNRFYLIYHILIIKQNEQHDVENQSRKGLTFNLYKHTCNMNIWLMIRNLEL